MASANATREDVARLLGRAAFGASETDMDAWIGKPYADLVDWLVELPDPRPPQPDEGVRAALCAPTLGFQTGFIYINNEAEPDVGLGEAQAWWLRRMAETPYPLEERMTLLWHGHFATGPGLPYPSSPMLMQQNQTLRQHALGNFAELVAAMNVDPAMLYWLNGTDNATPEPNENYAREFLELFTLGKLPQVYSERDIREAARAFTGWTADPLHQVGFNPDRHDHGRKTVLRHTVNDLGENEHLRLVDIALSQPVAPRFVAYKIVSGLGYLPPRVNQLTRPDPLVRLVADELRASKWNVKRAVRRLLVDPRYRWASPRHAQQMVREPIVAVVAACRALGVPADSSVVMTQLRLMGQLPFRPPNVGGWPVEREWLSPATMIARYDLGWQLGTSAGALLSPRSVASPLPASSDLNGWIRRLGLPGLAPTTSAAIRSYLGTAKEAQERERQATVLALLLASPDWMVM